LIEYHKTFIFKKSFEISHEISIQCTPLVSSIFIYIFLITPYYISLHC